VEPGSFCVSGRRTRQPDYSSAGYSISHPRIPIAMPHLTLRGASYPLLGVEVVLIAGGLTMAGIGHRTDRPRLKGAGLALAAEMGLTLGFDIFAARRAHTYRDELAAVDVQATVDPGGSPTAMITHTFSC